MLIGVSKDMIPVNFVLTRSKVNATSVTFEKEEKWFPLIILRAVYNRAIIFHMLIGMACVINYVNSFNMTTKNY